MDRSKTIRIIKIELSKANYKTKNAGPADQANQHQQMKHAYLMKEGVLHDEYW